MPVLVAGSTVKGSLPKYRWAISSIVPVNGGATDDRMMPLTRSRGIPLRANRCVTRMPISSAVRSRRVARRQLSARCAPSKTPSTMFVLPTSIARSIVLPVLRGSAGFYWVLFYWALFYWALFYWALFYWALFYWALFYRVRLYKVRGFHVSRPAQFPRNDSFDAVPYSHQQGPV